MRQILFRGKKKNGAWIYGDLIQSEGNLYIFPEKAVHSPDFYKITNQTLGQFTGVSDKNGVNVFEGDIVMTSFGQSFEIKQSRWGWSIGGDTVSFKSGFDFEVIGNIHDKLELLKTQK